MELKKNPQKEQEEQPVYSLTQDDVSRHPCHACHQVWPETMMSKTNDRWLCKLCEGNQSSGNENVERYRMGMGIPDYTKWGAILTVVGVAFYVGFRMWMSNELSKGDGNPDVTQPYSDKEIVAEAWATEAPEKWPVLVAKSETVFDNPYLLAGKNLFVMEDSAGFPMAVSVCRDTRKDVAEFIPQENAVNEVAAGFKEWKALSGETPAVFTRMYRMTPKAMHAGVTFLVMEKSMKLPNQILKRRVKIYDPQMKFTAVAFDPESGQQKTHPLHVSHTESSDDYEVVENAGGIKLYSGDGSASVMMFNAPADIDTLIGAPVIDPKGHVAAVITSPVPEFIDGKTCKAFYAFGMRALEDAINKKQPPEVAKPSIPEPEKAAPEKAAVPVDPANEAVIKGEESKPVSRAVAE